MSECPHDLESALGELVPHAPAINRDELMYEAGRAAAFRARGLAPSFWKVSTGVMTATTVGLVLMLATGAPDHQGKAVSAAGGPPTSAVADTATPRTVVVPIDSTAPVQSVDHNLWPTPRRSPARFGDPSKNYLALRAVTLERGIDAWPVRRVDLGGENDFTERPPSTARELLEEMLRKAERRSAPDNEQPVGVLPRDEESLA